MAAPERRVYSQPAWGGSRLAVVQRAGQGPECREVQVQVPSGTVAVSNRSVKQVRSAQQAQAGAPQDRAGWRGGVVGLRSGQSWSGQERGSCSEHLRRRGNARGGRGRRNEKRNERRETASSSRRAIHWLGSELWAFLPIWPEIEGPTGHG